MELDKLQAVLRQRTSFEAIDLGFAMFRRWWRPVYLAWFLVVLPVYLVVWLGLHSYPLWAFVLLWWLKPLFDRVPLFVISRALFGATPSVGETIQAMPRFWTLHLFHSMLLYRLDPMRSFFLPVLQLEGSESHSRSRRRAALLRTMGGPATWLTLACLCLDITVLFGLIGFVIIMIPEAPELSMTILWDQFWEGDLPLWLKVPIPVVAFLSFSLIEPLYVSAGFALYITRRTRLEGWDIELIFRRIAERIRNGKTTGATARSAVVAMLTAVAIAGGLTSPSVVFGQPTIPAQNFEDKPDHPRDDLRLPVPEGELERPADEAQHDGLFKQLPAEPLQGGWLPGDHLDANPIDGQLLPTVSRRPPAPVVETLPPEDPGSPESTIKRVLERPEFHNKEKRMVWRRKVPLEGDLDMPEMPAFLIELFRLLATGIEGILWVVVGAALAGLLILIFSRMRSSGPERSSRRKLPEPQIGRLEKEGRDRTLPPNVPAAAWQLWEQGRHDEALGLLYRGALAALVEQLSLDIEENATEGECLRTVRTEAPTTVADFFAAVTRAWQEVAYAHRRLDDERIRDLCTVWPEHFGART